MYRLLAVLLVASVLTVGCTTIAGRRAFREQEVATNLHPGMSREAVAEYFARAPFTSHGYIQKRNIFYGREDNALNRVAFWVSYMVTCNMADNETLASCDVDSWGTGL